MCSKAIPVRFFFALAASFISFAFADGSGKPAAPIELKDFQKVAGILAWSYRLPADVAPDEYARLEWTLLLEDDKHKIQPTGIGFPELRSNDELKIFLWVKGMMKGNSGGVQSIHYCIQTRGIEGIWKEKRGLLRLPEGFTDLYGFEQSGPSDLDGFVMLLNAENDKESALLNLRFVPRTQN